jgi:anti-sigma-K factor RskA
MNPMSAHPTREEDFDLYALGALEDDEKLAIESHVSACSDCARKLAEARGRISLLALAAPQSDPSPLVKQRLMAQVHASRDASPAAQTAQYLAPRAIEPATTGGGFFGRWWAAVLVPVGAALAVATIVLWNQKAQLDHQLAEMRVAISKQQSELDEARHLAALFESKDTITIALAPQPGTPPTSAHVMYNAKMGMLMYDGSLLPTAADKSYQLWLVPMSGDPINAGVFNPVAGQSNHWMMKLPPGIAPKEFAITLEPAGGMPRPTGPMVLVGAVT